MAAQAVQSQDVVSREFNSYSFNMKKDALPKAKTMIREFVNEFLSECEAKAGEGDETVQLNLQLFKITN